MPVQTDRLARLVRIRQLQDALLYAWQLLHGIGDEEWTLLDGLADLLGEHPTAKFHQSLFAARWQLEKAARALESEILTDES